MLLFTRETENLISIVAYRDDELDKIHPAVTILKQLAESCRSTRNIYVADFDLTKLDQLVGFITDRIKL